MFPKLSSGTFILHKLPQNFTFHHNFKYLLPSTKVLKLFSRFSPTPCQTSCSPLILISKMNFNLYLVSHPNLLYSQYLLSQWMDSTNTKLPRIEIGTSLKALVSLTWSKCFFFFLTLVPSSMFQFVEGATTLHKTYILPSLYSSWCYPTQILYLDS